MSRFTLSLGLAVLAAAAGAAAELTSERVATASVPPVAEVAADAVAAAPLTKPLSEDTAAVLLSTPRYAPPAAEDSAPGRLLAEEKKPKRKFCNTTKAGSFAGDYAYEACGAFCKQAKATNHCKFCKCKACAFCAAAAPAAKTTAAPTAKGDKALRKAKKDAKKGLKAGKKALKKAKKANRKLREA